MKICITSQSALNSTFHESASSHSHTFIPRASTQQAPEYQSVRWPGVVPGRGRWATNTSNTSLESFPQLDNNILEAASVVKTICLWSNVSCQI